METQVETEPRMVGKFLVPTETTGQPREVQVWDVNGVQVMIAETLVRGATSDASREEITRQIQEVLDAQNRIRQAQETGARVSAKDALLTLDQLQLSQKWAQFKHT